MGIFIRVKVNEGLCDPDQVRQLVDVCPVNVFAWEGDRVVTDPENEDECTLCGLCLGLHASAVVTVRRLYRE